MRRLIVNLSLVAISSLLGLLLAEGAVRLAAPIYTPPVDYVETATFYKKDDLLGWKLIPGAQGERIGKEFRATTDVNSLGMRDQEYAIAKPPGVRRIVVLGDSFVEGWQLPLEKNFTKLLEKQFNQSGSTRYQVLNMGVSGYNLAQYYLKLANDVEQYQPDMVIMVVYLGNDIIDTVPGLGFERHDKPTYTLNNGQLVLHPPDPKGICEGCQKPSGLLQWVREHSALFQLVKRSTMVRWALVALGQGELLHMSDAIKQTAQLRTQYSPEMEDAFAVSELLLKQSDTLAKSWGVPLLVVLAPDRDQLNDASFSRYLAAYPALQAYEFEIDKPQRLLLGYCEENGIQCFDLSPALREAVAKGVKPYYTYYDVHWNEEGHRIASGALYPLIVDRLP